ncbi:MAG: hypothetical protein OHK0024_01210 [Thalassobaculales bacterium]
MLAALILVLLMVPALALILPRWQRGLHLLALYMPVSGMVTLWLHPSALPVLYKDLIILIPTYFAFFVLSTREIAEARLPSALWLPLVLFALLVLVQMLNPNLHNAVVALIGAKVWLFYVPLLALTAAALRTRADLVALLRVLLVGAPFVALVGLVQWGLVLTIGYQTAIRAFYGDAAFAATQSFAVLEHGGAIFRIPGTFTFVTQYTGYLLSMLAVAYMVWRLDPSPGWRRLAVASLVLCVMAAATSGVRGMLVFVPLLMALIFVIDGRVAGLLGWATVVPLLAVGLFSAADVDPMLYAAAVAHLADRYGRDLVIPLLLQAIEQNPLGLGTGMNTGASRYALPPELSIFPESFYAKAVNELGIPGLVLIAYLFGVFILLALRQRQVVGDAGLRAVAAAVAGFLIMMAAYSLKGWQLDLDPINAYFWMLLGIAVKLPWIAAQGAAAVPVQVVRYARPRPLRTRQVRRPVA